LQAPGELGDATTSAIRGTETHTTAAHFRFYALADVKFGRGIYSSVWEVGGCMAYCCGMRGEGTTVC